MNGKMSARLELIKQVQLMLGYPKVGVELSPDHFELAVSIALERYRLRSSNAVQENFMFLITQAEKSDYQLTQNIMSVNFIRRRTIMGTAGGFGAAIDPFALAAINQYLLAINQNNQGGLVTFELYYQYQELLGRMFGQAIQFRYDKNSHVLHLDRYFRANEPLLISVMEEKTEDTLITDYMSRTWIRDYSIAKCKEILGEIRGKFSSFATPTGASLNGDALKAEAQETMQRLEEEVKTQTEQEFGYPILIG